MKALGLLLLAVGLFLCLRKPRPQRGDCWICRSAFGPCWHFKTWGRCAPY